ncbi:coproporphyrinogen dehydrogenase HemZ [Pseudoflavonifractor sp. An184]|uniref:coproporphyrinogen dehydrogenase HemZ n=1 Tax=Pseudoflavonifractor sp. An184 TaxID=1965576 RepID=UPI000B392FB0|nr:coproporphyrinogen dehydrogenase HemZ [Pseudoflavonifractor sp. An184]OUP56390.1 coproporphyrinogen dehydrogenase HemZ [Pseudoflavonifractor sp. An184]
MKLYFEIPNYNWQPERYKYSVEQMMLMLFPGERPEYPEGYAPSGNEAVFSLDRKPDRTAVTARVTRPEGTAQGETQVESRLLDEAPERVYHTLQHALKMAFYQAGTAVLGQEPPWGALTGVRPVKLPTRCMLAGGTPEQAQAELEGEYRVSPLRAKLAVDCAQASLAVDREVREDQVSLYIGIPFCPTRCAYCSFVSADVGRTLKLVEPYLEAVLEEVEYTGRVLRESGLSIHSLYVGGGTPTTLSAGQLERLFSSARAHLPLETCVEYTVEAGRPDTITREKLEVLRDQGVERISINPQTLEDEVLAAIGRKHSAQDILDAYALAREVGFDSINMDLIAGLPRDSFEGFRRSLEGVLALRPENVTVHTLALKKGSRLMEEGGALPSGEETARMLDFSRDTLREAGFLPYYLYRQKYMSGSLENVGWCLPGKESVYNIIMMEELQTVVSIGGGGVTKLVDRKNGRIVRLPNPKYPHDYLSSRDKILAQKDEIAAFYRDRT